MITIVTPTYNRKGQLLNLFQSLCRQTCKDFEWMVIDDGSTDSTKDTIDGFIRTNTSFPIRYIFKANGGKHTALNIAFREVRTELMFIVDSDDVLTVDAIATICNDWRSVRHLNLCGIGYLRGYSEQQIIGDVYPKDGGIDTFINVRYNQGVNGDKAEVWKTVYLRNFQYPEHLGEKFISESVAWIYLAREHKMVFRNKVIYITEYLAGGLSAAGRKLRFKCPEGMAYGSLETMSRHFSTKIRIKETLLYVVYSKFGKKSLREMMRCNYPFLVLMCYVPGVMLYRYWKWKY